MGVGNFIDKVKLKSSCDSAGENKGCCSMRFVLAVAVVSAIVSSGVCSVFNAKHFFDKRAKGYLLRNPDDMIEALKQKEASMQKERAEKQKEIEANAPKKALEIYEKAKTSSMFSIGSKNATHVVLFYYDYACGYCKKGALELKSLIQKRNDVKIILKDFPILGQTSLLAARASVYVAKNHDDKLQAFFFALISRKVVDKAAILDVASNLGINDKALSLAIESDKDDASVRSNYAEGVEIGANGTPVMIVDGKIMLGYKKVDEIIESFSK